GIIHISIPIRESIGSQERCHRTELSLMLLEHLLLPLSLLLFPFLGIVELVHIKTSLGTHEKDLLLTHHATLMQKVRIIPSIHKGCQNLTIYTQLGINKPSSDEFGS